MRKKSTNRAKCKKSRPKIKLGIPDLEHSKAAVLRSLGSPDSRRGYQHAIDEFVAWYCCEPRLAFNKTVVLRYSATGREGDSSSKWKVPHWKLVNIRAFMGTRLILGKEPYSGSMSELACFRRLRTSSSPRYQPFDANPDQTTDWHLAASNRFCEIFDEFALYSESV
jgi:hypothetical protein